MYTTCVCWAFSGILARMALEEANFSMSIRFRVVVLVFHGGISLSLLLASLRIGFMMGKVWLGRRAGLGYLKQLFYFPFCIRGVFSAYRDVTHPPSSCTVIEDGCLASRSGGERKTKSIRCPG